MCIYTYNSITPFSVSYKSYLFVTDYLGLGNLSGAFPKEY